jgi:hypothetical protein
MTRQNKENPAVLQGHRKGAETGRIESARGGKGVPINQQVQQLELCFGTAENPKAKAPGASGGTRRPRSHLETQKVPKPETKERRAVPATMEEVASTLREAFQNVASNRGAPGPDRQSISYVREHLDELLPRLAEHLLNGNYRPGDIRRVWIPGSVK